MSLGNLYTPNLYIYRNFFYKNARSISELGIFRLRWIRAAGSFSYLLLILFALLGLAASKERKLKSLSLLLIFYQSALCFCLVGSSRLRMCFVPFLIIYAGYFLGEGFRDWSASKRKWLAAVFIWLAFLAFAASKLAKILA